MLMDSNHTILPLPDLIPFQGLPARWRPLVLETMAKLQVNGPGL